MSEETTGLKTECTFGVCTSRYISGIPLDDPFRIDVPIGNHVVRWNLKSNERELSFRAHTGKFTFLRIDQTDVITCMIRNRKRKNICITASHSGEISSWSFPEWQHKHSMKLKGIEKVTHIGVSESGNRITLSSLFHGGHVVILDLGQDGSLTVISQITNTAFTCVELEPSQDSLFAVHEEHKQHKESIEISLSTWNATSLHTIKKHTLAGRGLTAVSENSGNGTLAIARMGRLIDVINISTLDILWSFRAEGSGVIKSLMLFSDSLALIPSDNKKLSLWNKDQKVSDFECPYGSIYFLAASELTNKNPSRIWMSNEAGLYNLALDWENKAQEADMMQITYHRTTCCGVDCHEDMIASGDFTGNVFLWKKHKNHPIHQINVNNSVRSISWRPNSTSVQIGTLEGKIWNWDPHHNTPLHLLLTLEGGITCIKWQHLTGQIDPHKGAMFAAGSTEGILSVVKWVPGEEGVTTLLTFKAHKPEDLPNAQFGSIHKFAEIWSLAWSPDNSLIATSSEDQTTVIWNLNGDKLFTLRGHTTAVTSVDWQVMDIDGQQVQILTTCADDCTTRIYKHTPDTGKEPELIYIFNTSEVEEWHTLTYLALEPRGKRLAVATQTGYVFLWNIQTKEKLFGGKVHTGSIEGLRWNGEHKALVTCSSDCTTNLYTVL